MVQNTFIFSSFCFDHEITCALEYHEVLNKTIKVASWKHLADLALCFRLDKHAEKWEATRTGPPHNRQRT